MDVEGKKRFDKNCNKNCTEFRNFLNAVKDGIRTSTKVRILCDLEAKRRISSAPNDFRNCSAVKSNGTIEMQYSIPRWRQILQDLNVSYNECILLGKFGLAVYHLVLAYRIRTEMPAVTFSGQEYHDALCDIYTKFAKLLFVLGEVDAAFYYATYGMNAAETKSAERYELALLSEFIHRAYPFAGRNFRDLLEDETHPHDDPIWLVKFRTVYDDQVRLSKHAYQERMQSFMLVEKLIEDTTNHLAFERFEKNFLDLYLDEVQKSEHSGEKHKMRNGGQENVSTLATNCVKPKTNVQKSTKNAKPTKKVAFVARQMTHQKPQKKATADSSDSGDDSCNYSQFACRNKFDSLTTSSLDKTHSFPSSSQSTTAKGNNKSAELFETSFDEGVNFWDARMSNGFSNDKTSKIVEVCNLLKQLYGFKWGCSKFLHECRYGERVIVQHETHPACSTNILLCHPNNVKGNWLIKVRIPRDIPTQNGEEYRICNTLDENIECDAKDDCSYAHSPEGGKSTVEKSTSDILFGTNVDRFTKLNGNLEGKESHVISGSQTSDSPVLDVIDLPKLMPLLKTHKFHLACLNCHIIGTDELVLLPHNCERNVVLCRDSNVKNQWRWQRVRSRPTTNLRANLSQFPKCRDFPRCPRSIRCAAAHSELERLVWNKELKDKSILIPEHAADYLTQSLVVESFRRLTVDDVGQVYVWIGCDLCVTVILKGYCQVLKYKHDCDNDIVLLRPTTWKQHSFWINVRRRYATSGVHELCRHVDRNDCWEWKTCRFAHSELEFRLWQLDDDRKRSKRVDLSTLLDSELENWRLNEPTYRSVAVKVKPKIAGPKPVRPQSQFPNGCAWSTMENNNDRSAGDRKRKRNSPDLVEQQFVSPFKVHYICGICYSRHKTVVYKRAGESSTKCDNRKEPHDFNVQKQLMIFDGTGRAYPLRQLPDQLKIKNARSVAICKLVAAGKVCYRPVCYYAHSEEEKRCWVFLLKYGKDVYDIVTEPSVATSSSSSSANKLAQQNVPLVKESALPSGSVWGLMGSQPNPYVEIEALKGLHDNALYCFLCEKKVRDETQYEQHCDTVEHTENLDVDQRREWTCRPPRCGAPFNMCSKHANNESCTYSNTEPNFCVYAHTRDELDEWNERVAFLQEEIKRKPNAEFEAIQEKVKNAKIKHDVFADNVTFANIDVNGTLEVHTKAEDKGKKYRWTFEIQTEKPLRRVALMDKQFLYYFRLASPYNHAVDSQACQGEAFLDKSLDCYYEVHVEFLGSKSLGTFRQEIVFDFGSDVMQMVRRHVTVHVGVSDVQLENLSHLYQLLNPEDYWTPETAEIHWISKQRNRKTFNPLDVVYNLHFSLNEETYFKIMRKLIIGEEMRRQSILTSFRVKAEAQLGSQLTGDDNKEIFPRYKNAVFARVPLDIELNEDVDVVELLCNDCEYAFVALPENMSEKTATGRRHVYEVEIVERDNYGFEGINSSCIYLCLSCSFTDYFRLKAGDCVPLEIQFNMRHEQFAAFERCIEYLSKKQMAPYIFPDLLSRFGPFFTGQVYKEAKAKISQLVYLENSWKQSSKNEEQIQVLRHVVICATNKTHWIPPLVIYGPFGTGKTRTLVEAVCTLLQQQNLTETKILVCTQSNTTADIYLRLLEDLGGFKSEILKPLVWRIVGSSTKEANLIPLLKQYVRFDENGNVEKLTLEKLKKVRVVISTTYGVRRLTRLFDEDKESSVKFTHIFMDEGAQALEVEMLQPLCVASKTTCIVVAGDYHQIRPRVYFGEAEELKNSYLERLLNCYEKQETKISETIRNSCYMPKILFTKNYRCHSEILAFLAKLFYDGESKLQACATIPNCASLKPMYFAVVMGREEIQPRSVSLCNKAEVAEIMFQVEYFWNNWPAEWGEIDIGIVVATHDQMKLVNAQLKESRRPKSRVHVGKTIMMQGKEFKVLIISTVRGRNLLDRPISQRHKSGFLDDARLINTAITRTRYCVVVVGDPMVLCSIGECKDIWRQYMETCFSLGSVLPTSYSAEQMNAEILIAKTRANASSSVDEGILKLAADTVNKMSGLM